MLAQAEVEEVEVAAASLPAVAMTVIRVVLARMEKATIRDKMPAIQKIRRFPLSQ
jgi:hypothetical protein